MEIIQSAIEGLGGKTEHAASDYATHIFLDMGGGNLLAFFDFPENEPARTVRGVGSMHHVALKAQPERLRSIIATLKERNISYSMHGSPESGSLYVHDPDDILVEVTARD